MGQPLGGFLTIAALIVAIILGAMWGIPQYRVYSMKLSGEAILAEAESSRQVAVKEALAAKDSATFKAEAEVIRATGAAEANRIIPDGLGGPARYLRYHAINAMQEQAKDNNSTMDDVATGAVSPAREGQRMNKRKCFKCPGIIWLRASRKEKWA